MEDRKILAKDARTIADSTNSLLNHIYKEIREVSKEGLCYLNWDVFGVSPILLDKVIKDLQDAGYDVNIITCDTDDLKTQPSDLAIRW